MGRDGQLEKDKRVRLAPGGADGIRFQSDDQRYVPVLQRDHKGGRGVTLRGHDVEQVSVRQFRAQYLKEGRPAVGHRSDRLGLACRIMKTREVAILAVVNAGTGERPGSSVTRTVCVFNVGDTGSRARSRSSERERYFCIYP